MGWSNAGWLSDQGGWYKNAGSGTSPEVSQFLARTSSLDATHISAYTALIDGLNSDGVWTKLDVLYILASQTSGNALLNLKSSSFTLTPNNSPTFTADQGYAGNGTTSFLDTGWIASTNGVNYLLNSSSFGAYILTNRTGGLSNRQLGGFNGLFNDETYLTVNSDGFGAAHYAINSSTDAGATLAVTAKGSWIVSRTGSSAISIYRNGVTTPVDTATTASTGVLSVSAYLLAANNNGSIISATTDQMGAAFFGAGLSGAETKKVSDRINTYMASLASPVNVY